MLSELRFSKFEKFISKSIFVELQLMQFKTSCCNLKIGVLEQNCVVLILVFDFNSITRN